MKKVTVLLLSVLFLWSVQDIKSQFTVDGQFDLGNNNLSTGLYLQFSNTGNFEKKYWGAEAGYQLGLVQPQNVFFNSWYGCSYGKIPIGKLNLVLGGEYMWTAFSPDLREINWIVFARTTLKHWNFGLGIIQGSTGSATVPLMMIRLSIPKAVLLKAGTLCTIYSMCSNLMITTGTLWLRLPTMTFS